MDRDSIIQEIADLEAKQRSQVVARLDAIRAAKQKAIAQFFTPLKNLEMEIHHARGRLAKYDSDHASPPLEGRRVRRDGRKRVYGVVEVRRLESRFGGGRGWRPDIGQAFVRLEKVDGSLGLNVMYFTEKGPGAWSICDA